MKGTRPIEMDEHVLDVRGDGSIAPRRTRPGPPERIDGLTMGIVTMTRNAPHGGEVHPDGDEILYVIRGKVAVRLDDADEDVVLEPGQACIVPKGRWHQVFVLEPTQLVHVTPGPHGDHRPLT